MTMASHGRRRTNESERIYRKTPNQGIERRWLPHRLLQGLSPTEEDGNRVLRILQERGLPKALFGRRVRGRRLTPAKIYF